MFRNTFFDKINRMKDYLLEVRAATGYKFMVQLLKK
jgi:hypothetical protein